MQLSQLEYLIAVKEYGSMSKAAAALFCSQPTITNAFKSIENEFGCKLVKRTSAGITFTDIGERIVEDARIILGITNRWRECYREKESKLRIAFSGLIDRSAILNIMSAYQRENPLATYALEVNPKQGLRVLQAEDGSMYRMGFIMLTPQELAVTKELVNECGMKIAKIDCGYFALFARSDNALMKKESLSLADLAGQKVVLMGGGDFPHIDVLDDIDCDHGLVLGDHDNIMTALLNGFDYVSFRPVATRTEDFYLISDQIVMRRISDYDLAINQYFIFPAVSRLTESEKTFVEYISKHAVMFEVEE